MKSRYLLTLFFVLYSLSGYTQDAQAVSGEVYYKVEYIKDPQKAGKKIKDEDVKQYVRKLMADLKKTANYIRCQLIFNREESFFKQETGMANDNGMDLNRTYRIATGKGGVYYTNLKENEVLNQFTSLDKMILGSMPIDSLDWEITDETKMIQGYRCQKAVVTTQINAINKREVTAWFAKDIPFQFGPMQFAGLPGLILGLERSGYYFYADEIKISHRKKEIKRPTKGEKMTMREHYNQIMNLYNNR